MKRVLPLIAVAAWTILSSLYWGWLGGTHHVPAAVFFPLLVVLSLWNGLLAMVACHYAFRPPQSVTALGRGEG